MIKNKFAYTTNLLKIPIEKIVGKADSPLSLAREGYFLLGIDFGVNAVYFCVNRGEERPAENK